jgi:hypothetical protein
MKLAVIVVGLGVALTAPLLKKAIRPAGVYALAGTMIAYEAACGIMEISEDLVRRSVKRIRHKKIQGLPSQTGMNLTDSKA